jgi:DNA-binding NarL/FixJ family response regulator
MARTRSEPIRREIPVVTFESPSSELTVLVSDSTQMGCELLAEHLSRCHQLKIVAGAWTHSSILQLATCHQPAVAVVSLRLDEGPIAGFAVLRDLTTAAPRTKAVLLIDDSLSEHVVRAFRLGATGVFCRSGSMRSLEKCIAAVHAGQIWAGNTEVKFLLEALAKGRVLEIVNANGKRLLTDREEQIVYLVAEGLGNREISERLALSEHTVKNYLFRIFDKLGISSRVELILYAMSNPTGNSARQENSSRGGCPAPQAKI